MLDQKEKTIYTSGQQSTRIEVRDNGHHRSLYFTGDVLQSRMIHSDRKSLCLSYTTFMAFPLLLQIPDEILVIGVGGGSIIRFLHHYFPTAHIDGVDSSKEVLKICEDYFSLPTGPHVTLHHISGEDFLLKAPKKYTLIQLDAFDHSGMSRSAYSEQFFATCSSSLNKNGLLTCNIWSNNYQHLQNTKVAIEKHFPYTIYIPIPDRGNIVAIASQEPVDWRQLHPRNPNLLSLSEKFSIDFVTQVKIARRANLSLWKHLSQTLDTFINQQKPSKHSTPRK